MVRTFRREAMERAAAHTHFGERTVRLDEKQALVDAVFHNVADRYDLMNDLMSFGLHRLWKDTLVARVRPPRGRLFRHLDVAGGTGDIALRVAAAGGAATEVTIVDINADMLRVGDERARKRREGARVRFVEGNAEALPLARRRVRRLHHRLRHPQRAAHRAGARRSLSRAEARRPLPLPGFSRVDLPLLRSALRGLFRYRDPRARQGGRPTTVPPIAIWSNRSGSFPRLSASPT